MRYLVDTDVLTEWHLRDVAVIAWLDQFPDEDLCVSIVSVEELLGGWQAGLRKIKTDEQLAFLYQRMTTAVQFLRELDVVSFSLAAVRRFQALRKLRLNVGSYDLRIAATALEEGYGVITRNVRDFQRVPGLVVAPCPG